MDQNPNQNNNPAADDMVNSAKSFDSSFDMSAINDAVAMSGNADDLQKTFDVNEISLDNTPTSNAELEKQMKDDPTMRLSGATQQEKTEPKASTEDFDPTKFDPVANSNISEMPQSSSAASFIGGDILEEKSEEKPEEKPTPAINTDMTDAVLAADPVLQGEAKQEPANIQTEMPKEEPMKIEEPVEKQEAPVEVPKQEVSEPAKTEPSAPVKEESTSEPSAVNSEKPSVETLFATDDSEPEAKPESQPAPAEEAPKQPAEAPKPEASEPKQPEKKEEPAKSKDDKKFKLSDKTVKPKSAQAPDMLSGKKRSPLPIIILCVIITLAMSAGVIALFYFFAK